jgi:hypothetical protein
MDEAKPTELVFRAESGGEFLGLMVVRNVWASALTERESIRNILTTFALQRLKARNPWPEREVAFRLVRRFQ